MDLYYKNQDERPKAYLYGRFSTPGQAGGDSKRRQIALGVDFAERHGLDLVAANMMMDEGISAFRSKNLKEGVLGIFLAALEAGIIKPGSYLLVESVDRLSRDHPLSLLTLIQRIIEGGIIIVTLGDPVTVYKKPIEPMAVMMLATIAIRANEESERKSQRGRAAWAARRDAAKAGRAKVSKTCPEWMKCKDDKSGYDLIPERAAVVRKLFDMSIAGKGIYAIAASLNQSKVPTPGKANFWTYDRVRTIIYSRTAIGEYQPKGTKRKPLGEAIKNYFPAVVSEDIFNRSIAARDGRKNNGKGRKGTTFSNLFGNICLCSECGSKLHFEGKRRETGHSYLYCSGRRLGICNSRSWDYEKFEANFLSFVREVDLESVINGPTDSREETINSTIDSLKGQDISAKEKQSKMLNWQLAGIGEDDDFFIEEMKKLKKERESLKARIADLEKERKEIADVKERSRDGIITTFPEDISDDELYSLRAKAAQQIRSVIERIEICGPEKAKRYDRRYLVRFKGGETRLIVPREGKSIVADFSCGYLPAKLSDPMLWAFREEKELGAIGADGVSRTFDDEDSFATAMIKAAGGASPAKRRPH